MPFKKFVLPTLLIIIVILFVLAGLNWPGINQYLTEKRTVAFVEKKFKITAYPADFPETVKGRLLQKLEESKKQALDKKDKKIQAEGWYGLFFVKKFINEYEEAELALQKAIELNPENYLYYAGLADLYHYELKDKDKALENYLKAINPPASVAIEFDVTSKISFYVELSKLYDLSFKDTTKAIETLKEGLDRYPDSYDIVINLAGYYQKLGDKEQALIYYKKAQEILPERAELIQQEIDELTR